MQSMARWRCRKRGTRSAEGYSRKRKSGSRKEEGTSLEGSRSATECRNSWRIKITVSKCFNECTNSTTRDKWARRIGTDLVCA